MKVLIFSGTTEGRALSHLLAERGAEVTVCVATDYGREEQGTAENIKVLTGRRTPEEKLALLRDCDLCVDATHPYAVEVTKSVRAACTAIRASLTDLGSAISAASPPMRKVVCLDMGSFFRSSSSGQRSLSNFSSCSIGPPKR